MNPRPEGKRALARGVAGWKVRVAKNLYGAWDRRGQVFEDRYHAETLRTPTQVRSALLYVLQNARRHGIREIPAAARVI